MKYRSFNLLFFFAIYSLPCTLKADTIWLAPNPSSNQDKSWYVRPVEKLNGQIKQFDNAVIVIVGASNNQETRHASSRVLWIESEDESDLEKTLRNAFAEGNDQHVLTGLSEVLMQRPPVWRQQWLTMLAAASAWRTHRGRISLELVGQLDKRPLPLMILAWSPILWKNRIESDVVTRDAASRIDDPSELVRLIASSWLLTSTQRQLAVATLESLIKSERTEIATLAEIVLWRSKSPIEARQSITQWKEIVADLPTVLQTGPIVMLKDKMESSGDASTAAQLKWSLEVSPVVDKLMWLDDRLVHEN